MCAGTFDVDVAVVGAGVVGLAAAGELAARGSSVVVVERHPAPGRETSSRNSEVIHAGIYYPTGSLKARLCVEGSALLYAFCEAAGVAHRRLGKLIVAVDDAERGELERLLALGLANGARDLRLLERAAAMRLEPAVPARAALHSPATGIVDTHGLIKALEGRARAVDAALLYRRALRAVDRPAAVGYTLVLDGPAGEETLRARCLVNAAGLDADRVAAMAGVGGYQLSWCKGDYFAVTGAASRLVSRLVYPVPGHALTTLGVHITLDLAGRMRLGPDATFVERGNSATLYDVDPEKRQLFHKAACRLLPELPLERLEPDMAGIRPRLQGPADPWKDFVVKEESDADAPGLVNLIGIESPGLTACLAIAAEIPRLLANHL